MIFFSSIHEFLQISVWKCVSLQAYILSINFIIFFISLFSSLCSVLYEFNAALDNGSYWNKGPVSIISVGKKEKSQAVAMALHNIWSNLKLFYLYPHEILVSEKSLSGSKATVCSINSQINTSTLSTADSSLLLQCGKHVDTYVRYNCNAVRLCSCSSRKSKTWLHSNWVLFVVTLWCNIGRYSCVFQLLFG